MSDQRNYSSNTLTRVDPKTGKKQYRWQDVASTGDKVNHWYDTRQSMNKSRAAYYEAIREGRITIDGVALGPTKPDHPPPLDHSLQEPAKSE